MTFMPPTRVMPAFSELFFTSSYRIVNGTNTCVYIDTPTHLDGYCQKIDLGQQKTC